MKKLESKYTPHVNLYSESNQSDANSEYNKKIENSKIEEDANESLVTSGLRESHEAKQIVNDSRKTDSFKSSGAYESNETQRVYSDSRRNPTPSDVKQDFIKNRMKLNSRESQNMINLRVNSMINPDKKSSFFKNMGSNGYNININQNHEHQKNSSRFNMTIHQGFDRNSGVSAFAF